MDSLNPQQLNAVEATEGPVLIVAGPGTGKTRTLTHRIAHLLKERQVPAQNILAITFTRSAALEMKTRLSFLLGGPRCEDLWVGTFHALALRLLREQNYPFGPGVDFAVVSEEEKPSFLGQLVSPQNASAVLDSIRKKKQLLQNDFEGPAAMYQQRLWSARRLDFDDLLVYARRLLDEHVEIKNHYRDRFRYVLVDEFQDTAYAQYELSRRLAGQNVCVAGDPDQAIYGFAAAGAPPGPSTHVRFDPFAAFQRDFTGTRVLSLSDNYRTQAMILEAAKQVIEKNRAPLPRTLSARLESGLPVDVSEYPTDRQESEMIVRKIESLLGGSSHFALDSAWAEKEAETLSYGFRDIAVLYRFQDQARLFERALERAGLPYQTFGKKPKRNGEPVAPMEDLEDFRVNDNAAPAANAGDAVTLMTLHRAKGLEFPVVFVAGCEDGVLPSNRSGGAGEQRPAEAEEERRLFYVGMTRAKKRLFLSYAKKRFLYGKTLRGGASPFLRDIREELRRMEESRTMRRQVKPVQRTLF